MSHLRRLTVPQRVVLVVGLGLLLLATWAWWYSGKLDPTAGWFAYAAEVRQTDNYFVVRHRQPSDLLLPVVLIGFWTAVSAWLLGLQSVDPAGER